jgi:hypothetical protein
MEYMAVRQKGSRLKPLKPEPSFKSDPYFVLFCYNNLKMSSG